MDKLVCVIAGSKSDDAIIASVEKQLTELGVGYSSHVCSAHRDPERLMKIISDVEADGCRVFICIAGMAAHLPGVVASHTTCPVIGVPVFGKNFSGVDALLSIVQMPKGIPVACVAVDGGTNAALLAAQILSSDPSMANLKDALAKLRDEDRK